MNHAIVERIPPHRTGRLYAVCGIDPVVTTAVRDGVIRPLRCTVATMGVVVDVLPSGAVLTGTVRQVDAVLAAIGIETLDLTA